MNMNAPGKKSIQAAAAVGLNITGHMAQTSVSGNITAGKVLEMLADNDGNFRTLGSGATMTLGRAKFSLAMGVAVSVNNNKAIVTAGETTPVTVEGKDKVIIASELSQNMDGKYKGYLGAQALAGSVTGTADAAIAGAVSVLVSRAETRSTVGNSSEIRGGDVEITAKDKSKLAVRAGGYSVATRGAKVGVGASYAFIYGYNQILAQIMDNVKITAASLKVQALKEKVSDSDYELPMGLESLITRSEGDAKIPDSQKGIIHLTRNGNKSESSYSVEINLSTDTILEGIDLLNFLSSVNYYAEAISGAVSGGKGSFSGAGSLAMVFFFNDTQAIIGKNVQIILTGDALVEAVNKSNVRIIAGSLSASQSNVGAGLTLSFLYNEDKVNTDVSDGTVIRTTGGNYTQRAESSANVLVITVAAAGSSSNAIGGNLGAIVMKNRSNALIGKQVSITADGNVTVKALQNSELYLIAASAAVSGSRTAAGGTLNVTVN